MRIQYTIETGIINCDGSHLADDYIETYAEDEQENALQAYIDCSLGYLRQMADACVDFLPGEHVYKKLLIESMEDDDEDDYIIASAEFLCEDDSMPDDELVKCPDDIRDMDIDSCINDLKESN